MFPHNDGPLDRRLRAWAGGAVLVVSLLSFGLRRRRGYGALAGVIGVLLLGTATAGSCPVYRLAGVDTSGR